MEPSVSVIIVTYNKKKVLQSCIESVLNISYSNYKIVVVDNNSTDGTASMVNSHFPSVVLLETSQNLGYTGGNNVGIHYALEKLQSDYILILNDDMDVDPSFLNELVAASETDPKIGITSPRLFFFEKPDSLYTKYGNYNFYLGVGYTPLINIRKPEEVNLIPGACILIKKSVIQKIGLMDTKFFLYFDEADLCHRVRVAGYKILHVPSAKTYHKVSYSFSGRVNPSVLYYSTRNELLFARKHLNPLFFVLWIPRFGFRLFNYLAKYRNIILARAMLKGFYDFTTNSYGQAVLPKSFVTLNKSGKI
ncbi:MAG: glycosyltransferase family 2 protein [Candidatus Bathyarchaeota archaeon]|nr:glycosyltransferase family 2 protein [Candidatus Bathyarchaeum sp.]